MRKNDGKSAPDQHAACWSAVRLYFPRLAVQCRTLGEVKVAAHRHMDHLIWKPAGDRKADADYRRLWWLSKALTEAGV